MSRHEQTGFTLLEVLVALAIVALSLTAISVTMGGILDNALTLRERTYASWIAQNKIVEIRAAGALPETRTTSGTIDYANSEWSWEAEVSETGVDGLLRIDVSVSRPDSDGNIRKVTGFVGEPVVPGLANQIWSGGRGSGGRRDDGDEGATN